jgi:hypothetical protein
MRITVLIFRGSDPSMRTICPPPSVARLLVRASSTAESKGLPQGRFIIKVNRDQDVPVYGRLAQALCFSKRRTVTKNREFCQI